MMPIVAWKRQHEAFGRSPVGPSGRVSAGPWLELAGLPAQLSNDRSCLLRVSGDRESLLLTGDIEREAERWLVRNADVSADVVLVPHHGSATSSTPAFVEATGAGTAVVSAGFLNRWDHPRPEVVARWQAAGARILRSDRDEAIRIAAGGIKTKRARRWPFAWRLIPATDEPEG